MKQSNQSLRVLILLTLLVISGCKRNPSSSNSTSPESSNNSGSVNISEETNSVPSSSEEEELPSIPGSSEKEDGPTDYLDKDEVRSYYYDPAGFNITESIPSTDPYSNINSDEAKVYFYAHKYNRATSYEDAMYRTSHGLVSGDIQDTPQSSDYPINHLPNRKYWELSNDRTNDVTYEYHQDGSFKSYTINNLEGKTKKVYYGAAYVTLEDVAAYVFAFGDAPANYVDGKYNDDIDYVTAVWGKYGRVNNGVYSSDVTHYKYEPMIPYSDNGGPTADLYDDFYEYREMDFGFTKTPWGVGLTSSDEPYNNGDNIVRSTVRLVYTSRNFAFPDRGAQHIPVEHRHVFLTYNHYNDFIEYLNYDGGWGKTFGWMSAGNEYCGGMNNSDRKYGKIYSDFINPYPPTNHTFASVKSLNDLKSLVNYL